jgi:hypothetical protein
MRERMPNAVHFRFVRIIRSSRKLKEAFRLGA